MGVQVRTAAFDGEGNSLPIIERQFISFSWGGRNIEDFDLIVVNDGAMMSKTLYAPFNDTVKNYQYIDGQSYWGTTLQPNTLKFALATDGMDSKLMEEFKAYFKPGDSRKLILTEFPFRYAYARVKDAPQMEMLPFEKEITNENGRFRVTEYKGKIVINFVLDDPYWYNTDEGVYFSGELNEEQKKDIYETGTPYASTSLTIKEELAPDLTEANITYLNTNPDTVVITPNTIEFDTTQCTNSAVASAYINFKNSTKVYVSDSTTQRTSYMGYQWRTEISPQTKVTLVEYDEDKINIVFEGSERDGTPLTLERVITYIKEQSGSDTLNFTSGDGGGAYNVNFGAASCRPYAYATDSEGKITSFKYLGYLNSSNKTSGAGVKQYSVYTNLEFGSDLISPTGRMEFIYDNDGSKLEPTDYPNIGFRIGYIRTSTVADRTTGKHNYRYIVKLHNIKFIQTFTTIEYTIPMNKNVWYPNNLFFNEDGTAKETALGEKHILNYVGTASGLPILKARYNIEINNTGVPYITLPHSSYSNPQINSISIENNIMHFTLSSLLSSYNQALRVVEEAVTTESIIEIKARLREQTSSALTRKWAIEALTKSAGSNVVLSDSIKTAYYNKMKTLFNTNCNVIFIFNSISGEITAQYSSILIDEANQTYTQVTESAGSCLKSAMLTIPSKTAENNGVFTLNAPNATELSIDYKYRFY